MSSRFTVIVPVYNVAGYVRQCLDSVVAAVEDEVERRGGDGQRTAPFSVEVICVDDGSTDGSGAILDSFASTLNPQPSTLNLRVIHQPNAGVSAARNRGIEAATGDWILFVDADDVVRPTYFSTVEAGIACDPTADLVGFGMITFGEGEPAWPESPCDWQDIGIDAKIVERLSRMSAYRFAYRRDVFGDLRFRSFDFGEDLMFVTEAIARARRCVLTERHEYAYRWRADSAMRGELDAEKVETLVRFNVMSFKCLNDSGKRVEKGFSQGRGNCWIEELPRVILGHDRTPAWDRAWAAWLDSMSVAAGLKCLTDHQRRAAGRVAAKRTRWSVRLNCLLPAWLRRKGLWRCS